MTLVIFENFEIALVFKNALGQFIPNCPPKYVITSTNFENLIDEKFIDVEQEPVELG